MIKITTNNIFDVHNTFKINELKNICNGTKEKTNLNMNIFSDGLVPIDTVDHLTHVSPFYLYGELTWYIMGENNIEYISDFSNFWQKIATNKIVNSNYGYTIEKRFDFNQLNYVIEILKKDKLSRRAIIHLQPQLEYKLNEKDIPCTLTLQFLIREHKNFHNDIELICISTMRSNDAFYGFSYDIPYFRYLQGVIYEELKKQVENLRIGSLYHNVGSFHIYEKDFEAAKFLTNKYNKAYNPFYNKFLELENSLMTAFAISVTLPIFSLVSFDKNSINYSPNTFLIMQILYFIKNIFKDKTFKEKLNILHILFNNSINSNIFKDKEQTINYTLYFVYCRIRYEELKKYNFTIDKLEQLRNEKNRIKLLEDYINELVK